MITSGGGFSTHCPQPKYQKKAVAAYFTAAAAAGQTPVAGYNAAGRGFPDVSLAGHNYVVFVGGMGYIVSGTSASAPVMAGLLSNINAARIAAGKGSVGWVNPALYTNSSMFINDITSGDNKCAGINSKNVVNCCSQGFTCTTGWDPVTGLGTVNYGKMESLFLSLGVVNKLDTAPSKSPVIGSSGQTVTPAATTASSKSPSASPTGSPTTSPVSPLTPPQGSPAVSPSRPPTTASPGSPSTILSSPSGLPSGSRSIPPVAPAQGSPAVSPSLPLTNASPGSTPTLPSAPSISPLVALFGAPNRPPTTAPQKPPLPSLPIRSSSRNPTMLPNSLPLMPSTASPTPGPTQTSDSRSKFQCKSFIFNTLIML